MALPAFASGEGFEKAWAGARPGWYVRMEESLSYIDALGHSEIFPRRYIRVAEERKETLSFLSGDTDQRSKPIFLRKITIPQAYVPNCFDNRLIFQVDGEDIEMYGWGTQFSPEIEPPSKFWFAACYKIIHWELLRKSCGDENFIACITGKFSKKFPFDIIFNLPSTEITCPKVKFFGSEFDICFIYEAMRLMKYPISAALIIKLFLYL